MWASLDRGASWTKINNNLPTVAVHELAQHPTAGEIVAATHGRSLWVLDVTPLRQMKTETLKAQATLYKPATAVRWHREPTRGTPYGAGNHRFVGQNPSSERSFFAGEEGRQGTTQDRRLRRPDRTRMADEGSQLGRATSCALGFAPVRGRNRGRGQNPAPPGMYRIVFTVDGKEQTQGLRVENDPLLKTPSIIAEEDEDEEEREKRGGRIDD